MKGEYFLKLLKFYYRLVLKILEVRFQTLPIHTTDYIKFEPGFVCNHAHIFRQFLCLLGESPACLHRETVNKSVKHCSQSKINLLLMYCELCCIAFTFQNTGLETFLKEVKCFVDYFFNVCICC